ncbi:MAG: hypothetical protein LBS31_00810 [Candidatus Adiutrix sp.]|jgi:iron complex outermembrane receptor protein|nr:hypothetical protein [Candidatus Adiutrix sp.]
MEVYKYPQPSRFGTGYGMINFIPKHMTEEGYEFRTSFQGGSYGAYAENMGFGLKDGAFDVYAAQSWVSSDGYLDHSRAQQQSYYLNMGFQASENWNLRLLINYVDAQTLNPVFYPDGLRRTTGAPGAERYDTETSFTTVTLSNQYDSASGYVKFYYNDTDFHILGEPSGGLSASSSEQSNQLSGVRVRETFNLWEGNEIVAGFDLDRTRLKNTNNPYVGATRIWNFPNQTVFSPYAAISQFFGSEEAFHLTPSAGLRYCRHNVFDDEASPQAGLVLGYGNTNLNFNYAKGVNYPSPVVLQGFLQDKALPANFITTEIKPEAADHYEVGLTHSWPELATLGLTYFNDKGKDRTRAYMYGPAPTPSFWAGPAF